MNRKWLAFTLGGCAFAFGIMLFALVPQQFFPSAERDQFVIDVWMPQGTRIEATDAVMGRIEKTLGASKGVAHYATFVGQSSPRFYYNVNPQQPDGAYGQFIVNTASVKDTTRLVKELRPALAKVAPEAMVIVKELQQGAQTEAPIEVRISGDDIGELKRLGEKVQGILEGVSNADYVFRDYFNDSYMVDVKVNDELANRLGITDASVSQTLSRRIRRRRGQHLLGRGPPGQHQTAAGPGLPLEFRGYRQYLPQLGTDPRQGAAPRRCPARTRVADQQDRPQKRRAYPDDPGLREAGALRLENTGGGNAEDQGPGITGRLPDRLRRREI